MTLEWVYLVYGSTGEYSDRSEWVVAAYVEEDAARQHAELANGQLREAGVHSDDRRADHDVREEFVGKFYLDTECRIDYTGTSYGVQKVPLVLHVDQYMERFPK